VKHEKLHHAAWNAKRQGPTSDENKDSRVP